MVPMLPVRFRSAASGSCTSGYPRFSKGQSRDGQSGFAGLLGRKDTEFGDGAPQRGNRALLQQRVCPACPGRVCGLSSASVAIIYLHPVPVKHRETVRRIRGGKGIGIEHTRGASPVRFSDEPGFTMAASLAIH